MGHVNGLEDARRVVGVHVADEAGLQLQAVVLSGPVFQGDVHGAGAEVAAADADLHDGGELLTGGVRDLAGVDLLGKCRGLFLLAHIERALVDPVLDDGVAELTAGELVEHQALFAGVDHLSVIEGGKFLRELGFRRELAESVEHRVVHGLGREVIAEALRHGHTVCRDALCAALARHHLRQVHAPLERRKFFISRQGIKIFPCNHRSIYPFLSGNVVRRDCLYCIAQHPDCPA